MPSESSSRMAQHLVNAFASVESTEGLILFVAGTDHMLNFCQGLLEQYDRDSSASLLQEVNSLCKAKAVLPGILYAELRKVLLALNRFHDAGRDHFAVLGLPPHATREEVKQAYRALSKQYHPDRQQDSGDQSQRFMEIAGAYHAIMATAPRRQVESHILWRGRRTPGAGRRPLGQRLFFPGIIAMICLLAGVSIYLAGRYNKRMIISQLQASGSFPNNNAPRKIPEKSDAPQIFPAELPPPRNGQELNASAPREVPTSPATDNRQAADNQSSLLSTVASSTSLESSPLQNTTLTVSGSTQPASHTPSGDPEVRSKPASARQKDEEQVSQPVRRKEGNQQPPSPSEEQRLTVVNEGHQAQPTPLQPIISGEEIVSLINRYSELYSRKELVSFLTLFAQDATENGHPLHDLTDQYRSLFAHTRAIVLQIVNTHWEKQQDGFLARGNFRSSYTYNDGRTKVHTGDITFLLTREKGALKIRNLEYNFIE